ncbi:hypothetical protein BKA62DRAFT_718293 [Auriculariales sp. MPI-PUGE-AT-0066]|nr:hypothetical protein BKA62DRAFT_718293 [Auriculariales sp. MPI-PUGE-AT-0066]
MPSIRFPGAYPDGDMTDTASLSNFSAASDDGTYFTALEYPESQQRASVLKARKVSVVPKAARVTILRASSLGNHSKAPQTPRGVVAAASNMGVSPTTSSTRVLSTQTVQTPMPAMAPVLSKPTALSVQEKRSLGQALYIRGSESYKPFIPCAGQCQNSPTSTTASAPSLSSSRKSSTSSTSSGDYGEWRMRQSQGSMSGVSSAFAADFATDPFRPRTFQPGRPSLHGSLHLPPTPSVHGSLQLPPTPGMKTPKSPSAVSSVYATEVGFRPRVYQAPQTLPLHLPNQAVTASSSAVAAKQAVASESFPRRHRYPASAAPSHSSRLTGATSLFGRDLSNDPFRPQAFVKPNASKHAEIYLPKANMDRKNQARTATPAGESLRSMPSVSSSLQASLGSSTKSRKLSPLKGLGKKVTSILSRAKA